MTETIEVPESVTVRSVAQFAGHLLTAADTASDIALDIAALVECDLSFVQLLLALRTHLERGGFTLTLTQPAGPALRALLDRAGFAALSTANSEFWFHGNRCQ